MQRKHFDFEYEVYESMDDLSADDKSLLQQAQHALALAYVPYSHFKVGAAASLANGEIYKNANQENASFPITICAERALLSTINSLQPGMEIKSFAISYVDRNNQSYNPISPCGMCRQAMLEFEKRFSGKIRIILGGKQGRILIINGCENLLPFSFSSNDLG